MKFSDQRPTPNLLQFIALGVNTMIDAKKRSSSNKGPGPKSPCNFKRLRGVNFPSKVLALTHVLDQVDTLLMTPEEAIVEAARSGQLVWLKQLIHGGECSVAPEALVAASANGNLECVDALLKKFFCPEHHGCHDVQSAAKAAAGNGHRGIVELLLREEFYNSRFDVALAASEAFDGAAANGHLDVVKFVVQLMKKHNYAAGTLSLARPILGGHSCVVEFLLGLGTPSWWGLIDAFAAAVDVGQPALADRILDIYFRTTQSKTPLLVQVSRYGKTNAAKYLYNHGDNVTTLVSEAFEGAAINGCIDTMEFLFSTRRVSSGAFNRALEQSVTALKKQEVLSFLCGKKCGSSRSINRVFKATSNSEMIKYLYDNENISTAAVISAFKKAATWNEPPRYPYYDEIAIVKLLHKDDRIPAKVMGEALVSAASKNQLELVETLRGDSRISVRATRKAFVAATSFVDGDVMAALYDKQRIPVEMAVTAFKKAKSQGFIRKMEKLVKFLPSELVQPQGLDAALTAEACQSI